MPTHRPQFLGRREVVGAETRKRESLYGEFIAECSKLLVDALDHALDNPDKLLLICTLAWPSL